MKIWTLAVAAIVAFGLTEPCRGGNGDLSAQAPHRGEQVGVAKGESGQGLTQDRSNYVNVRVSHTRSTVGRRDGSIDRVTAQKLAGVGLMLLARVR